MKKFLVALLVLASTQAQASFLCAGNSSDNSIHNVITGEVDGEVNITNLQMRDSTNNPQPLAVESASIEGNSFVMTARTTEYPHGNYSVEVRVNQLNTISPGTIRFESGIELQAICLVNYTLAP